jgi:hypothetical protein
MPGTLVRRLHVTAALLAFTLILTFWTSTAVVELAGPTGAVIEIKQAIRWGLLALVPALATAGATGFAMGGRSTDPRIVAKKRRMPFIAGLGLLVLVPSALYLAARADSDDFDTGFHLVQAVELTAGAANLTLMSLNIRDGLRLTGRLHRSRATVAK